MYCPYEVNERCTVPPNVGSNKCRIDGRKTCCYYCESKDECECYCKDWEEVT